MPFDKKFSLTKRTENHFSLFDHDAAKPGKSGTSSDEYIDGEVDLNEQLIQNKHATFFVKVSSDAMREAGIYKGDIVIVDRSLKAGDGKVVIAILNGDMLIRRFEKQKNAISLVADSNKLAPINLDQNSDGFAIWGVVTYVIHKL